MECLIRSVVCFTSLSCAIVGCAASTPNDVDDPVATGAMTAEDDAPPAPTAPALEAFVQEVDKTTITFDMVPVAGGRRSDRDDDGSGVELAVGWNRLVSIKAPRVAFVRFDLVRDITYASFCTWCIRSFPPRSMPSVITSKAAIRDHFKTGHTEPSGTVF